MIALLKEFFSLLNLGLPKIIEILERNAKARELEAEIKWKEAELAKYQVTQSEARRGGDTRAIDDLWNKPSKR